MAKKRLSDEHRKKISLALKGKRPKNLDDLHNMRRGRPNEKARGENSKQWKGDDVSYHALHSWINRWFGKPNYCSECGTIEAPRYEWHNISGNYSRDRSDWTPLCVSCHRKITFANADYVPWNKGRRLATNTGRTHIKSGQHISPETEFKPGLIPWNKHLEPKLCPTCGLSFQPRESERKFCSQKCYWASLKKSK